MYVPNKFKIMKKVVVILAIFSFVGFGALGIQNVTAFPSRVEIVKFDKDPKKAGDKKTAVPKDTKATGTKAISADSKVSTSSGSEKSATSKGCTDKDKAGCCSSSPDKK
jgi:hypothetical protein